jgi:hypothetical protein
MTGWTGRLALVALLALGLVAAGCGDDDDEETAAQTEATADVDRYCELARQLDKAGEKQFAQLEEQELSRKEFEEAEVELFREHEAELEELQQVAPPEIQADVETLVARFRARAGLGDDAPTVKQEEVAEERVTQFEEENCGEALFGEEE